MNRFCAFTAACLLLLAQPALAAPPQVDFNRDIRPILFSHCVICHGPDEEERAADLRLDEFDGACEDLGGYAALVPGDPEESEIMVRVLSDDDDMRMPPPEHGPPLGDAEKELLERWIREGGRYAKHWSYEIPRRPELPPVKHADWVKNPIDRFALAKMEAAGLSPKSTADRLALARRVAIDLTGLPPTWEEACAFAEDDQRGAYERYVDALLRKPEFGERWARVWLDLARYADSAGYADDPPRTIWAYRDYVIRSLNENKPFDQFTLEQIAGDLLDDPSDQQLVATAFHRNTLTNNEGGTNDEEFRNVAVVDRVNTTMAVWMGTTMACAQCHTHKYDPITQEEYFKFFAFFNNTEDADKRDERPLLSLWSDEQLEQKESWTRRIAQLKAEIAAPNESVDAAMEQWLVALAKPPTWSPMKSPHASAKSAKLSTDDMGWVHLTGDRPDNETFVVKIPTSNAQITALKLETEQPSGDNFVLSQVLGSWNPQTSKPIDARYVRLSLKGDKKILHVAEIQAFRDGENIALGGKAKQSSTDYNAPASRAIDGNTDGDFQKNSVTHSKTETNPWIEIDLGGTQGIDRLVIWNRTDNGDGIASRLNGFELQLLSDNRDVVWESGTVKKAKAENVFPVGGSRPLVFASATADFEQKGFPASSVIAVKPNPKTGWAVAPQPNKPHALTLVLKQPLETTEGTLTLTLKQTSEHTQHLLQRFRVSATGDKGVSQWSRLPANVLSIIQTDRSRWKDADRQLVRDHYRSIAPLLSPQRNELEKLEGKLAAMKPNTTVPIFRQLPSDKRRETNIQIRGNYLSKGDVVSEGTPSVFHPIENADAPTRLDLARWLVDRDNPLTARVIANRHWEELFGVGIVETSEEFGSQGSTPSHPQLLDWLAVELQESGWDLKHLIRLMVTSATYQQSSVADQEQIAADPKNRLLARGPRFRISAEMVRDQALAVSGLLSKKMYGPPVKPPQPELGLKAAFGSATDWKTSGGEDKYRRGIYTTWRRSSPYPSMAQFDAPNREVCTVRRIRTNTPLQALVTLNDPVYIEAAQSLARRMIDAGETPRDRLEYAFRTCLIREPSAAEVERLIQLVEQASERYSGSAIEAVKMAADPLGPLSDGKDPIEHAAWTIAANVILNLDEMFLKR